MTSIRFMHHSKKYFIVSLALFAVIIAACLIRGVQLDIMFRGGSIITYAYSGTMDFESFEQAALDLTNASISVQQSTDLVTGTETMVITLPGSMSLSSDELVTVTEGLQARFPDNGVYSLAINNVSASMGSEFLAKCLMAVAAASLLMIVFVAFRFRKIGGVSAGVMGVVALVHDVFIVFGVFVVFGIPLNDNFIAVVLTIIGFSLNDTIVIYDRIRENKKLFGDKRTLPDMVDLSINQSFSRSVYISVAAVMAMVIVTIVAFVFDVESILTFSFPMILGLISGVYSTICIAGPLWVRWQLYSAAKKA